MLNHIRYVAFAISSLIGCPVATAVADAGNPNPSQSDSTTIQCTDNASATSGQQVTATPEDGKSAKEAASQTLQKFAVSSGTGSTIVTSHIASAYAPMNQGNAPGVKLWNDLGFDFSASVNAQNQTQTDYLRQEVLTRFGGIGNLYLSLAGRNACNPLYSWGDRLRSLDHIYLLDQAFNQSPKANQLLVFVSQGVGIKAIKESTTGSNYSGLGSAYLGIGIDGPLFSFGSAPQSGASEDSSVTTVSNSNATGFISWEVYISENVGRQSVISAMFNAPNAKSEFSSWGTIFRAGIGGCFDVSLTYSSPLGKFERQYLPGTTLVSFGYNRPSNKATTC